MDEHEKVKEEDRPRMEKFFIMIAGGISAFLVRELVENQVKIYFDNRRNQVDP